MKNPLKYPGKVTPAWTQNNKYFLLTKFIYSQGVQQWRHNSLQWFPAVSLKRGSHLAFGIISISPTGKRCDGSSLLKFSLLLKLVKMTIDAEKKLTEGLLRSVLISSPGGVPLHKLAREFKEVGVSSLPALGLPCLGLAYLSSVCCALPLSLITRLPYLLHLPSAYPLFNNNVVEY